MLMQLCRMVSLVFIFSGLLFFSSQAQAQNTVTDKKTSEESLNRLSATLKSTERSISSLEDQLARLDKTMAINEQALREQKKNRDDVMIELYELGDFSLSEEFLINKASLADYATQREYSTMLLAHLDRIVTTMSETASDLNRQRQQSLQSKTRLGLTRDRQKAQSSAIETHQQSLGHAEKVAHETKKSYPDLAQEALSREQMLEAQLAQELAQPGLMTRGAHVLQGQTIGAMGTTGYCYAEGYGFNTAECGHLHFEVIKNGQWVDPRQYVPGALVWPFDSFHATQEFGDNWRLATGRLAYDRGHTGRDLVAESGVGTAVHAAGGGDMIEIYPQFKGWMPDGLGCYKVIDHGNGLWTVYGHLTQSSCSH